MTVAQHRAAAQAEEQKAHEDESCAVNGATEDSGPCWTSVSESQRRQAEEHRRLAAEHRHAAALRAAEEQACKGVSKRDRVQSPFSHYEDIVSVQPLVMHQPDGSTRDAGAVILFREVPGLTAASMQKIIDCHLARNAAFGLDVRELEWCPLAVNPLGFKKLHASVAKRADGLAVTLQSDDEEVAKKVLSRAELMVGPPKCLRTPVPYET